MSILKRMFAKRSCDKDLAKPSCSTDLVTQPQGITIPSHKKGKITCHILANQNGAVRVKVGDKELRSVVSYHTDPNCTIGFIDGNTVTFEMDNWVSVPSFGLDDWQAELLLDMDRKAAEVK